MIPPDVALERFLQDKHRRGEENYAHILGRVPTENFAPDNLRRWLVEWMNRQLSDLVFNSIGSVELPPLHFDLVCVQGKVADAHVFETEEFAFIVVTEPLIDEMFALATRFVRQNRYLFSLQIAPEANPVDIVHFFVFLQFCFVTSHEYSHLVRRHLEDNQPHAAEIGEALTQTQELDADGYAIYHDLTYLFNGAGRLIAATWLKISNPRVLNTSILDCFLYSLLIQFCARWTGRIQRHSELSAEHPPPPVRIEYALLFVEMWSREVGGMSTEWMTAKNLGNYFSAAANLFAVDLKKSWDERVGWLRGDESEPYRSHIRTALNRVRTGQG